MEVLRGYGLGPNLDRLLTNHLDQQRIVPKSGKSLRKYFQIGIGVTQGKPVSPMIFNIVVNAVARAVLDVLGGPQEAQHGLGWAAGDINLVFYAKNGRIPGQDREWVKNALTVAVTMLRRMGLETNLDRTKSMVFTPCFIWEEWGEQAYKRRATG